MKISKKFAAVAISATLLISPIALTAMHNSPMQSTVEAATSMTGKITLVKGYSNPMIYDQNGKLLERQPQNIDFTKPLKFYGQVKIINGPKIYAEAFINGEPQVIIDGVEYVDLGDGGYIPAKNVGSYSWTTGILTLVKDSYVYNKNGKKLSTYRGQKAFYKARSSVKYTGKLYTYHPNSFISIGNGYYLNTSSINTMDGKGVLKLNTNTAIYNKYGKRITYNGKRTLAKYDLVNYSGKTRRAIKNDDYFYYVGNKKYSVPTTKINSQNYYSLGGGAYIKSINVDSINGHALFRDGGSTTVTPLGDLFIYNSDFKKTKNFVKQGKKIEVDEAKVTGQGDMAQLWFRISGTKGNKVQWLLWGDDSEYGYNNDEFAGNFLVRTRIAD